MVSEPDRTTLGAVAADVSYGFTARATLRDTGVRFLRTTDIVKPSITWADVPFCEVGSADLAKYKLLSGDIVISRMGTVGASALVNPPHESVFASYLVRFRIDPAMAVPAYVAQALRSPDFWNYVASRSTGSVQPNFNAKLMREFAFPLPGIPVQRGIAGVLGALDDKIESSRRKISVAHELGASLCQLILGSPTERWTDAWPNCRLDDVLSTLEVGRRPVGGIKYEPNGIPSIGAESIIHAGSFDFSKTKRVSEAFFADMRRGHLEHLDVLLYKDGGTPGNFIPHVSAVGHGFPFSVASINEHVYRLRVSPPYSQSFLYFWLSSPRLLAEMRRRGTGAAIPGLNSSAVRDLPVLRPPPHLLSKLQDALDPLLDLILRSAKESRACAQLRDALLPELLSGRLRVPEAATI
jgi:type I restriction enzyme S subunit